MNDADEIIVTIICCLALAVAGLVLLRLGDRRRSPPRWVEGAGPRQRLGEAVRVTSALLAAGLASGILVAGFGGRLLMRLIAASSDDSATGRLTEADEVVGEITAGGTGFLVLLGGGLGVLGGLGYFLFRRWLPARSVPAGLVVAGIGAGILARPSDLLNPASIDFVILGPRWLAALLALALIAGLGAVGGVLIDTFVDRWPTPAFSLRGVAGLVPLAPLIGFGALGLILAPLVAAKTAIRPGRFIGETSPVARLLPSLFLVAGATGWLWTLTSAIQIAI